MSYEGKSEGSLWGCQCMPHGQFITEPTGMQCIPSWFINEPMHCRGIQLVPKKPELKWWLSLAQLELIHRLLSCRVSWAHIPISQSGTLTIQFRTLTIQFRILTKFSRILVIDTLNGVDTNLDILVLLFSPSPSMPSEFK